MIGIDFDNTIVCYDQLFARAAVELKLLPAGFDGDKKAVKQHLQQSGRGDDWTRLQGCVYGQYIDEARPFEGFIEFLSACRAAKMPAVIISHRTRHPYLGPELDLHAAARRWIEAHLPDFAVENGATQLAYFEETKEGKLWRIREFGCRWFIDDLPEFLAEPGFPPDVERILFDPLGRHGEVDSVRRAVSWREIAELLL